MFLDGIADSVDFFPAEATAALQPYGVEPKLGFAVIALDMDVWRLASVPGIEEEPKRAHAEHSRHAPMLHPPSTKSNRLHPLPTLTAAFDRLLGGPPHPNKDRPEHRNAFVGKYAALLRKGVAVSIVDLVTVRHVNLYADVLAFLGYNDPTLSDPPPHIYATSCRWLKSEKTILEGWWHILTVGQPLPTLPLWLSAAIVVPLDLEQSYEQACHDLWIT